METRKEKKERMRMNRVFAYISFCENHLANILAEIGITTYKIGGSVAAYAKGIDLGRAIHDIDVIIPEHLFDIYCKKIKDNPYFLTIHNTSSTDSEFRTKHLGFLIQKNYMCVDIISDIASTHFNSDSIYSSLNELIMAKRYYNRSKDYDDMRILLEYRKKWSEDPVSPKKTVETTALGDLDMLEELKKRLDGDN